MINKFFASIQGKVLLPTLAFISAFFLGGVVIVLTDSEIMNQIKSPGKFLTAAGAKIANSYLAIFQGSIFDIN
jgi:simple sugar transport system permease protein